MHIPILLFLFGLMLGSFLNVCIYRIPLGKSLIYPGSTCPKCGQKIQHYDNIPVLSYILLRGKCRTCKTPVSFTYPTVELLGGIATLAAYLAHGLSFHMLFTLIALYVMIAIFFIDLNHMVIPDSLVLILLVNALLYIGIFKPISYLEAGIGLIAASLPLYIAAVVSKGGLGGGDIKLMAVMGVFLGWKNILLALLIGCMLGALVSLALILLKKRKRKDLIPFGPFLCIGITTAMFFGTQIVEWYLRISGIA